MVTEHAEAPRAAPLVTLRRSGRGLRRRYGQDAWGRVPSAQPPASSIAPYVAFAQAWWWLVLIGLIVGVGASAAYLRFGPIPHRSLAYILVPSQENPGSDSLGSPALLERAAGNFAVQAGSQIGRAHV